MTIMSTSAPAFRAPGPFPLGGSPFTPLGWTTGGTPVYPAQGGRGNGGGIDFIVGDDDGPDPEFDDDRDEDDDEDDEQDDDPRARRRPARRDDGEGDEWTPPDRDSYERLTTALKRANSEAGRRRRVGKEMERLGITDLSTWLTERGIDPATGHPFGNDVVSPGDGDLDEQPDGRRRRTDEYGYEREPEPRDDDRTARQRDREVARQVLTAEQRGRAAARDELMPVLAEYAARTALRDAGFTGTKAQLERALRSIDPGTLDLDLDGDSFELVGIDEAIEELRNDLPGFFEDRGEHRTTRPGGRTSRGARDVDGGDRGRQRAKPQQTWAEKMAEQMARRGR